MITQLRRIAHVRSGDKGNASTLGIFAYEPDFYAVLCEQVTADVVKNFYGSALTGDVVRYEISAIDALNFTMNGALGGGVSRSLAIDNYGKALGAAILALNLEVPDDWAARLRGAE